MKKTILAFLLVVSFTAPVFASTGFTYLYKFSDRVQEDLEERGIPGMAVAIVDLDKGFAFSRGYGYADAEKTVPVTENTLFQTEGVSASITALLAVRMAEEGTIDLDAKVSKYVSVKIPSSPVTGGNFEQVTVRMLMECISGLPDFYLPGFYSFDKMDGVAFNNLHAHLNNQHMSFKPYENLSESQVAVTLLGYLLAKTAYPELPASSGFVKLTDTLLKELDMTSSSFWIHEGMEPLLSYAFDKQGEPLDKLPVASGLMPATSLWTSASEMKNYLHFLLDKGWYNGKQILNTRSFNMMFEPDEDAVYYEENSYYGLTWLVKDTPMGETYWLEGGGAYPSALIVHPGQRVGVFIACNGGAASVTLLAYEFLAELLTGEPDVEAWQARAHISTIDKVWDQLTDFTGFYYGDEDPIEVVKQDDVLYIVHPETGYRIAPDENDRYVMDVFGNWLSFKKMEGTTNKVYILENGYPIAMKMTQLIPSAHAENFYGVWTAESENARYWGLDELVIEQDKNGLARVNNLLIGFLTKDTAYTYGFGSSYGLLLKQEVDETGRQCLRFMGERYYQS